MDEINNTLSGQDGIEKTVKTNYETKGLEELTELLKVASKNQKEFNDEQKKVKQGEKAAANLLKTAMQLVNVGKTVAGIFKNQLLTNVNALNDSMETFAGVSFSSMLSFSKQLSTISNYTKEIISNQIS